MSAHELDIQGYLTGAITGHLQTLSEMVGAYHSFFRQTPPNSEQPTELPRGIGFDVLAIIDAKKILAIELKKTDHVKKKFGEFVPGQKEFLAYVDQLDHCVGCLAFDRVPSLNFHEVKNYRAQHLARLNALTVVRPRMFADAEKNPNLYIGERALGSTMLDVLTRIIFDLPDGDPDIQELMTYFGENVEDINNCILWFIGDGYARELTVAEVKRAFDYFRDVNATPTGKAFRKAYERLSSVRKRPNAKAAQVVVEQEAYQRERKSYLEEARVAAQAPDIGDPEPPGNDDGSEPTKHKIG